MARNYHVDIAAFAADVDRKWNDNLLSHFDVPGVESENRGVARRLSRDAIRTVILVRALAAGTGMPIDRALSAAARLLETRDGRAVSASEWLALQIDRDAFDADVDRRLAAAVEAVVPRRRGRPPTQTPEK
jgi:hypothetical protein